MKLCENCGAILENEKNFCGQCGLKSSHSESEDIAPSVIETTIPTVNIEKKPLSPKTKKIIGGSILVIVLLFGLNKFGHYYYGKERLLEKVTTAIETKDSSELTSIVTPENSKLEVNKQTVKPFMKLLNNKEYRDELIELIHKQASYYTKSKKLTLGVNDEKPREVDLYLRKNGKKFGLFPYYEIVMKPQYINVTTNYPNTIVEINGKNIGSKFQEGAKVGPYLPGEYDTSANLKTDFINLDDSEKVYLSDASDEPYQLNYELEADDVSIDTPFENTSLYLNDKKVGDYESSSFVFGPVLYDGSLEVYTKKTFPWGEMQSDTVSIDSSDISLDFYLTSELKDSLLSSLKVYLNSEKEALKSKDISKLKNYTENSYSGVSDQIESLKYNEESYTSTLQSLSIDNESDQGFYEEDGMYKAYFSVVEKSKTAQYYSGEQASPSLVEDEYDVTFVYNEKTKTWQVNSYDTYYW